MGSSEYVTFFVVGVLTAFLTWVYSFDHSKYITAAHPSHIKTFYDYFGSLQDWQRFYEAEPVNLMLDNCDISDGMTVLEIGFGTGYLANNILFQSYPNLQYTGIEVSDTMFSLAQSKLSSNSAIDSKQWTLLQANVTSKMISNLPANSFDRVVSTFVFDLLPRREGERIVQQLGRVLNQEGRICLTSLTNHLDTRAHIREAARQNLPKQTQRVRKRTTQIRATVATVRSLASEGVETVTGVMEELFIGLWECVARVCPICLGGCRPINLMEFFDDHLHTRFDVVYEHIVASYGVPSQVVVAAELPNHVKNEESYHKRRTKRPDSWHRGHRT